VSTTSVAFTAIHNESAPASKQVGVSVSGGTVYVDHTQTGSTFTHTFAISNDQANGTISIAPKSPTMPPRTTYTGTVTVRGCPTQTCSSDVAGSPAVIKVAYTIDPQVALVASPQSLSFSQLQGGAAPAAQTLALSDVDDGDYPWNASVTYQSGSGWLKMNGAGSASGPSLPASLSLSINPSSTLGTLNAVVHITGKGKPIDVPVSYAVSQAQITASPAQLTFNATNQGASPPTQDIALSTQASAPVDYTTSVKYGAGATGWLNAPASGTAPGTLTVGVSTTNLAPGTYTAALALSTATRTISIGVTYVVAASSLTLNPSSASFTIDSTSVPAALSKSVNVGATGASLNWTAASSQPWVTVSPSSGSSGTTAALDLVPAQLDALDPGMRSATVTFSYTPPGGSPTSRPLAVSLNLLLPKVSSVTPYVATSGTSREVILRGLGFNNAAGSAVKFGSGPTVSSYTVASDTEIRVTHPSLTANSYRVSIANQLDGVVRSTADLVVVDAPAYAATTIAYPNAKAKGPLNIAYDAQRRALLVGVAYPSAGQSGDIFRYTFSGSAWSATPASAPVSAFRDVALNLDGRKLIVVSDLGINQLDPTTLAAGTPTSAPFSPPIFLSGAALANDGNAVVTTGTQSGGSTNVYRYSVGGGSFSAPIGSLFSAAGGASADGSRAVFVQGSLSPPQNVFQYTASNSTLSAVSLPLARVLRGSVLDRRATRIVLNGSLVYDATFQQQGKIPDSLAVVLSVNGAKAYGYSSGTLLHTYDLNGPLDMNGFFPEIAPGTTLASDPGSNPVMTMSPDGGTLFIAGADAIVVVPAP
jgi:hypothetical protein